MFLPQNKRVDEQQHMKGDLDLQEMVLERRPFENGTNGYLRLYIHYPTTVLFYFKL